MEREHQEEYADLRRRGYEALSAGEWSLRLEVRPSFDDAVAVGVVGGREPRILERVWSSREDADKLRSPVERLRHPTRLAPTMRERSVPAAPGDLGGWLAALEAVPVPVFCRSEWIQFDGRSCVLAAQGGMHRLQMTWGNTAEAGWAPIQIVFDRLWGELTNRINQGLQP